MKLDRYDLEILRVLQENEYEPLGLQVRPLGGDNFEALQYRGGLPGQERKPGL